MLKDLHKQTEFADKAELRIGDIKGYGLFYAGTEYTPPARGTWTIAHTPMLVPELHEIFVCPDGCLRGVVLSALEGGFMNRFSMISVRDEDLYNGRMEELFIEGVSDIINKLNPKPRAVMVFSSCIHDLMALDRNHIFDELQRKFPDIDILNALMNCTMRKSGLNYEEVQWRQNYSGIKLREKDPKAVNIIGNYFAMDKENEIYSMLENAGFVVRDICEAKSYEDYQKLGEAALNIYNAPVAGEATRDLEGRLGQKRLYIPFSWDYAEIEGSLENLGDTVHAELPDIPKLRKLCDEKLAELKNHIGNVQIQVDAVGTQRPFGLAKLLLEHGFNVTKVYSDAVMPGDEEAFDFIRENNPDVLVSAMVDFRLRLRNRGENSDEAEEMVLAIGQRAAYFSGTEHFVNLIAGNSLYGFSGIIILTELIREAFDNKKDTRKIIQIKAKGCCG